LGIGVDEAVCGEATRHDITGEEIQRAMGRRSPAYPHASRCWRVAFVVVLAPGQTQVPAAMLAKVERYRQRWSQWFTNATDGRGVMRSNLSGPGCPVQTPIADPCDLDAGVVWPDGGVYVPEDAGVEPDAGTAEDAGIPEVDAGQPEADAGMMEVDAGPVLPRDGGVPECISCDTTKLRDGCNCNTVDPASFVLAFALLLTARRRR
jgi:MYXO-CTERM domain-containing protein